MQSVRRWLESTVQSTRVTLSCPAAHSAAMRTAIVGIPNRAAVRHRRWKTWPSPGTMADATAHPSARGTDRVR